MKTKIFTLFLIILNANAFATEYKSTMKLRIQSAASGYWDEATFYFDKDIIPGYKNREDVPKVYNNLYGMPNIFSLTSDYVKCSTNGFGDLSNTEVIALGLQVDMAGIYKVTSSSIDNFNPTCIIRLEDRLLGTFTDMRANFYQVQLSDTEPDMGRFYLHVTYPVTYTSTNAGCSNNDGTIGLKFDTSVKWDIVQIYNATNPTTPIATYSNVSKANFTGLAEGDYNVQFLYGTYMANQTFHVTGNHVNANIVASTSSLVVGEDATFSANATHANMYSWDFGDGTLLSGIANPSLAYLYSGNYTINLTCSNNYGCSATAQLNVSVAVATGVKEQAVKPTKITTLGANVFVDLNDAVNNGAIVQVYSLLGEAVYVHTFNAQKETIDLGMQPNGYYIVSVKNGDDVNTKRVFLNK